MLDDIEPNYNHVYNPPMPPDTPLALPYPNLKAGTQVIHCIYGSSQSDNSTRETILGLGNARGSLDAWYPTKRMRRH